MKRLDGRVRSIAVTIAVMAVFVFGMMAGGIFHRAGSTGSVPVFSAGDALAQAGPAEESIPDVVERVVPAVVYIQSKTIVKQQAESPMTQDPLFRRFFDDFFRRYNVPREREQQYLGSGVIVSDKGYILTNNHLVQNAEEVEVILPDK
ncbi:MAG TPA: hypothetical protein VLA34_03415, partial [Candidatus Krumholzibacterium sp.]|nr:hypothetical protein [Candidatus Krumholzibacterium sp.]